jgi:hypothetical protein
VAFPAAANGLYFASDIQEFRGPGCSEFGWRHIPQILQSRGDRVANMQAFAAEALKLMDEQLS